MGISAKQALRLILSNAGCPSKTMHEGTGPISISFDANDGLVVRAFLVQLAAKPGTAEDLNLHHKVGDQAQHNVLRFQTDMDGVDSVVIDDPIFVSKGDTLTVNYANSENVPWSVTFIHGRNA